MVRETIERIHEKLPEYEYIPLPELKEELYPEKMNTEELASALEIYSRKKINGSKNRKGT